MGAGDLTMKLRNFAPDGPKFSQIAHGSLRAEPSLRDALLPSPPETEEPKNENDDDHQAHYPNNIVHGVSSRLASH